MSNTIAVEFKEQSGLLSIMELLFVGFFFSSLFLSATKWTDPKKEWGSDKSDKENTYFAEML